MGGFSGCLGLFQILPRIDWELLGITRDLPGCLGKVRSHYQEGLGEGNSESNMIYPSCKASPHRASQRFWCWRKVWCWRVWSRKLCFPPPPHPKSSEKVTCLRKNSKHKQQICENRARSAQNDVKWVLRKWQLEPGRPQSDLLGESSKFWWSWAPLGLRLGHV